MNQIPAPGDHVSLPADMPDSTMTLHQAIGRRRSVRDYGARSLLLGELARLLHSTYGVTDGRNGLLAAPSAGALYPLEVFVAAHRVEQLAQGIYRYLPREHALVLQQTGDLRGRLKDASIYQDVVAKAAAVLAFSAVFYRTRRKYGERATRYIMLDMGHAAQNTYLSATALGLGACAVGAFLDDQINEIFGVDGATEAVLYMVAVGTR